jgi:hypothetical protein
MEPDIIGLQEIEFSSNFFISFSLSSEFSQITGIAKHEVKLLSVSLGNQI